MWVRWHGMVWHVMSCGRNVIGGVPCAWGALTQMQTLALGFNEITSLKSCVVANMTQLRSLVVNTNQVDTIPPELSFLVFNTLSLLRVISSHSFAARYLCTCLAIFKYS
jgi:subtilase family serine protease